MTNTGNESVLPNSTRGAVDTTAPVMGTGLGLAIAKSIAEAHGGSVLARFGAGGSRVSVSLPVELMGIEKVIENRTDITDRPTNPDKKGSTRESSVRRGQVLDVSERRGGAGIAAAPDGRPHLLDMNMPRDGWARYVQGNQEWLGYSYYCRVRARVDRDIWLKRSMRATMTMSSQPFSFDECDGRRIRCGICAAPDPPTDTTPKRSSVRDRDRFRGEPGA